MLGGVSSGTRVSALPHVSRFAVRFAEQVWPGDVLTCAGQVREVREEDGRRVAELDLAISRDGGGVAVSGTATVRLED